MSSWTTDLQLQRKAQKERREGKAAAVVVTLVA
jgi:hypothetical protein